MRTDDTVSILGAGGHARVVVDALLCCGWQARRITLRDDCIALAGKAMLGCRVETPAIVPSALARWVHAAIGDNAVRQRLLEASGVDAGHWLLVRHPAAVLAASARVGAGSFLGALSVTGPNASIGRAAIVNHGAVVDHDCQLGDFSHVGPRASLGGGVRVGAGVLVGAGATVLAGVAIGEGAVIGAGAVVLADVAAGQTVVGVPARPINKEKTE